MQFARPLAISCLLLGLALTACRDAKMPAGGSSGNAAATMGGYGPGPTAPAPPLLDAQGQAIPLPPVPGNAGLRAARSGDDAALAVWVRDGHVVAASFARGSGWTAPQPLEQIHGQASDPEIASNGHGTAMAVWRHTVGNIQSLRFSRFDAASGWSTPDVMPGALPQPDVAGAAGVQDAPRLEMDAQGNVTAEWRSGLNAAEVQVSRYAPGSGWSRALSQQTASASPASLGHPAAPSVR
jgi:hypothetical protein